MRRSRLDLKLFQVLHITPNFTPCQESWCTLSRIDEYAEIDDLIAAESRGIMHSDGSFLADKVW
jgi:hypothetical protein